MGVRKGGRGGQAALYFDKLTFPTKILANNFALSFDWVKWNFTTLKFHPWTNLLGYPWKNSLLTSRWNNPSDA